MCVKGQLLGHAVCVMKELCWLSLQILATFHKVSN